MGQTKIQWAHYTFNPWWGCSKVSAGCKFCYADTFDHRLGGSHWGAKAPRRFFSDSIWKKPVSWNAEAKKLNRRYRVFSSSMADIFENRKDLIPHRKRLFDLIENTPNLDWLLLTKRPENWRKLMPDRWLVEGLPPNVWLGMTIEDQLHQDKRLHYFKGINAGVRFVSFEPLLKDIMEYNDRLFDWAIIGLESGNQARLIKKEPDENIESIASFIQDLKVRGIKVFFKQLGTKLSKHYKLKDSKGGDIEEYPQWFKGILSERNFPINKFIEYEYTD